MSDKPIPRPRQVSLLGFTILAGSAFVVLLAFQQVASLGTIEAQESAERLVSEPPGSGLGLSADQVQSSLRVLGVIAGGCATAAAFLGWQVLQRARSARLALSLLAPVLLVTGVPTSGFLTAIVVAAIAMLWVQPARDWFAGVVPAPRPDPTSPATSEARDTMSVMSEPTSQPGQPYGQPSGQQQPYGQQEPYGQAQPYGYGAQPPAGAPQRPGTVLAAGITTIVASAIVLAGSAVALLLMLGDRSTFEDAVNDELAGNAAYDDFEAGTLIDVFVGLTVVCAVWALVAILLAVLAVRGSNGARITLVVSAIAAALFSLLGILAIVPVLFTAACITVAVLLLRRDAATWYAARRRG